MPHRSPIVLVHEWQAAVNNQDVDGLIALSAPNIEIVGPRGAARGHAILREWLSRAGLSFTPQRVFARDGIVVVAQHATWRPTDAGEVVGEADIASCFHVAEQQVVRYGRYDSLNDAFEAGGLTHANEVTNF